MNRPTEEIAEIERHKYFLSEQKGYDVGWEFAENDWEANFADDWRLTQCDANTTPMTGSQTASIPSTAAVAKDAAPGVGRRIKKFFGLVFSR